MNHHSELSEVFRPHLQWHRARLDFLAAFVLALIRVRSVNLAQIAVALNPWVHIASNYRRCQRFLAGFSFDQETIGRLILQLLPQDPEQKLVLSLDRTEWKLGRLSINLLFIGVAHQGVAYPLVWCFLGKAGSSNLRERLGLLRRL
ncbi:MAG: transposase, partial [Meiothermus sp.]|nr:transposase [Meiothermus sp.]